ncbi:histidine phosphatase family protein [Candidatus Pelagibacter sp.]|jgi:phosphohistidine phosphatase SixA|nr:histidine phosphatase family protein [Candidatus Pelagibacter sp.]
MKKLILIFSVLLFQLNYSFANDKVIESLKEGGKLIFIRHALAPGSGDPENFELQNCSTQRNLNEIGIQQSKKIGLILKKNEIKIDNIYSSEWCRCKDTAKYAFDDFETFDALNSFYDTRFAANEDKQIKDFYEFIDSIDSKNNIVFVTHYVVIGAILNIGTSSGEIVVTDKNLNIIGSIDTL